MVRFLLEITALVAAGMWGWKQSDSWLRFLLALGIPILLAAIWGIFAVPDDPSRSGQAPVAVAGIIRLAIELAFFGIATWSFADLSYQRTAWIFGLVVATHYILSYDRIGWLLNQ